MSAPIGNTCPDIDKVISGIKDSISECNPRYSYDNLEDANDALETIDNELYGLEDMLEELRSANSALRTWGEEMESEIIDLQSELDNQE